MQKVIFISYTRNGKPVYYFRAVNTDSKAFGRRATQTVKTGFKTETIQSTRTFTPNFGKFAGQQVEIATADLAAYNKLIKSLIQKPATPRVSPQHFNGADRYFHPVAFDQYRMRQEMALYPRV
ncbi:MAG TPA: hypothetical protein PLU80_21665 [Acidobacteriota bacterium]|nr:hypothetical protein [Acidobacteriota bacterium]HNG96209.1 hypothetical protein [Acidobacteriota bacterium]